MDLNRKEEILKEIEKEKKICKEIYKKILENRVKHKAEIKRMKQKNVYCSMIDCGNELEGMRIESQKENFYLAVGRRESSLNAVENSEFLRPKELASCSSKRSVSKKSCEKNCGFRVPLGSIQKQTYFDGMSSRKNPLDSLRNTTERNDLVSSLDSLQYSEDVSIYN